MREKTRRRKSIGGRWKEKRGGRKRRRGRRKVTRWKGGGSRRVEDGWVAASKGCQDGGTGAEGGQKVEGGKTREGGRGEGLRGWKTHPFSCLPSLAV